MCRSRAECTESYLRIDAILDAVRRTGAQAVHPGYGFLSENAEFAEKVSAAGASFVGPNSVQRSARWATRSRAVLAEGAGVDTIPGFNGILSGEDEAAKVAAGWGYPVMIKASAGGGGKGMRRVERGGGARGLRARSARRRPPLATTPSTSSASCRSRATSRSSSWPTARQLRLPARARVLDPAAQPEGGRGGAGGPSTGSEAVRAMGEQAARSPRRSATARPARSSIWSTRTSSTTSSR